MKKIIGIVLIGSCCCACNEQILTEDISADTTRNQVTPHTPELVNTNAEDTLYQDERFLVIGNADDTLQYEVNGISSGTKSRKGDTLYQDKEALFIGDWNHMGIYEKFVPEFDFADYLVEPLEKSKMRMPDFSKSPYKNDSLYVALLTDACRETGVDFGGHYTLVESSCGAMCTHIHLVDRSNGRIIQVSDACEGKWGYEYRPDSRLLIANSELLTGSGYFTLFWGIRPEFYVLENDKFKRIQ